MGKTLLSLLITLVFAIPCFASLTDLLRHVFQDDLRSNFKSLVAANPNYFGNAPESNQPSVTPLSYDTQYEQLVSIGFDPVFSTLEATIEVKLNYGFGGALCTNGSLEHVRFYSRNSASATGWDDLGAVTVNTRDIVDVLDCNKSSAFPLFYVLTLPFQPIPPKNCELPQLPEIRAILSWSQQPPPNSPLFAPVWGNVLDQHIQSPKEVPSLASTFGIRSNWNVGKELWSPLEQRHPPQSATNQQVVSSQHSPASTISTITRPGGPKNILFEELIGLGLDYDLERIVATIRIKRPDGYGTVLCGNGTLEHIAFWADWYNNCKWTYLGELTINVYNIPNIPLDGLTYSAALPVDLRNVSNFCNTTRVSRIRAVLSWNLPPLEPPQERPRGNLLEVHVQIPPYSKAPNLTAPTIYNIGGVAVQNIDTQLTGRTLPGATFAHLYGPQLTPVDPAYIKGLSLGRPCPFGGIILISGPTTGILGQIQPGSNCDNVSPSQYQYRIVYRDFGSTADPIPLTGKFPLSPSGEYYQPLNSLGYFNYLPSQCNTEGLLGIWSPPIPGLYQIRLEIATQTSANPLTFKTEGYTDWYNVDVADPHPVGTFIPTNEPVCGTFPKGTDLEGTLTADAAWFGFYEADVINSNIPIVIEPGTTPHLPNPGFNPIKTPAPWSWSSAGAPPCGYVARLVVYDRTILNSNPTYASASVPYLGFCVGPPLSPVSQKVEI